MFPPAHAAWFAGITGTVVKLLMLTYPFKRLCTSPLEYPLEIDPPGANSPPSSGVLPAPRNAVPAPESKIEKGVPDWTIVTPLIDHPPRAAPLNPVALWKIGRL